MAADPLGIAVANNLKYETLWGIEMKRLLGRYGNILDSGEIYGF